ncbi:MAG: diguanylate cyclase [Nitrospirota bacterium]|nr:MAG: diguanylate cyclase [Nitrospirota bacterium]
MERLKHTYLRLNIAKKLLLGYLSLGVLIIIISVYALSSLERLNDVSSSILETDVPLIDSTGKMVDALLAQELYARRYAILKSPDMLGLFWKRNEEFASLLAALQALPDINEVPVEPLTKLHEEYSKAFLQGFDGLGSQTAFSSDIDKRIKENQEKLISLINSVSSSARNNQNEKVAVTRAIGSSAVRIMALLCAIGLLLGVGASMMITRNISSSISRLKLATEMISEGRFDDTPEVANQDELGDLSFSFREMAQRLKRLEEMYLDASPLTHLPGGIAIETVLKKRLESGRPLAFCLVDLDNFKAYNDHYGYARGSDLIVETSRIIDKGVKESGDDQDFVGHIGGDDFVIITTPNRFPAICGQIIENFDSKITDFYNEEDREKGYIVAKSRQGEEMSFPLISLSIAVVTNQNRRLENHIIVGEIAAELKEYAKSIPGSLYVVDQRREESLVTKDNPKVVRFPKAT